MRPQPAALALAAQSEPLLDPEAVLLVDDDEPEVRERHFRLEQGVRSHRDRGLAAGDAGQGPAALATPEPARQPDHVDPERIEPSPEAREVLLGEQLGGRHEGDLALAGHRRHRGDGRDHRLAGAHVALHQPVHRTGPREVGADLAHHPALGGGQLEGQRVGEPAHQRIAAVERRGLPAVDAAPRHAQREVVREQLLEREAPPCRMLVVERRVGLRARRRPVDRAQGVGEAGETVARCHRFRQQVGGVGSALEPIEGLPGQPAEQRLAQPRCRRIDRRQAVGGRGLGVVVEQPVLGVRGLDAAGGGVHLPVAGDAPSRAELLALVLVEVEQPYSHRRGAVADGDHEGAAPPESDGGALDPAARERGVSGAQVSDRADAGAVLVSQREVEQQVEHRLDPEPRELRGDRGTDAPKLRHRRGLQRPRGGGCGGAVGAAGGGGLHVSSASRARRVSCRIKCPVVRHDASSPWLHRPSVSGTPAWPCIVAPASERRERRGCARTVPLGARASRPHVGRRPTGVFKRARCPRLHGDARAPRVASADRVDLPGRLKTRIAGAWGNGSLAPAIRGALAEYGCAFPGVKRGSG